MNDWRSKTGELKVVNLKLLYTGSNVVVMMMRRPCLVSKVSEMTAVQYSV